MNQEATLFLFLLDDDHKVIEEAHYYRGYISDIDMEVEIKEDRMDPESLKVRKGGGGYHDIEFTFAHTGEISPESANESFGNLLSLEAFDPDERLLDYEYYFFGIILDKPAFMSEDTFNKLNALLINQIVCIEDDEDEDRIILTTTCTHDKDFYSELPQLPDEWSKYVDY